MLAEFSSSRDHWSSANILPSFYMLCLSFPICKKGIFTTIWNIWGAKYANCRATSTWCQFQKLIRDYIVFTLFNSKHQDCFNLFTHHLLYHQSWVLLYSTWHVFLYNCAITFHGLLEHCIWYVHVISPLSLSVFNLLKSIFFALIFWCLIICDKLRYTLFKSTRDMFIVGRDLQPFKRVSNLFEQLLKNVLLIIYSEHVRFAFLCKFWQ